MGQSLACAPPKLTQQALDALCDELIDAAEFMADEQILCVADTLRNRRELRCRVHQRVEERLCAGGGQASPA